MLGALRPERGRRSPTAAAAVEDIVRASGADEPLVRAQLAAVAPALGRRSCSTALRWRSWAEFDARFGILEAAPDIERPSRCRRG